MDFTAYQANSRIIRVSVTDESGSPKNLTGQTITMVFMRPAVATQSPFDRASGGNRQPRTGLVEALRKTTSSGITVTSASGGVFEVSLTATDTANLVGEYYYEIALSSGGTKSTIASGSAVFLRTTLS